MSTNTAATKIQTLLLAALCLWASLSSGRAQTHIGPWVPIFRGIDLAKATNSPGAGALFQNQHVVRALRVDLSDPDLKLLTSPRNPNYVLGTAETVSTTVTSFVTNYACQVAVNANFFDPSSNYYPPPGTSMYVYGLMMSRGVIVSLASDATNDASFLFTTNNQATFIPTNWPAASTVGIYTAVSGQYALLVNNVNVGSNYLGNPDALHGVQPRTAYGLSNDRKFLYLITIDGRQPGYSDGAYDWETAKWLQTFGANDGANMDGGGSTEMVQQDSTGAPVMLDVSSAVAGGGERQIGSVLGIYARPLPNFITNVVATPDDTVATISWQTTNAATAMVNYGTTLAFGSSTPLNSTLTTNHAVILTNLAPFTGYYYQVVSTAAGNTYVSSNYVFRTTNYVVTSRAFDIIKSWSYNTNNLDSVNWTATNYDDSAWPGSGPGLLWYDRRGTANALPQDRTRMGTTGNPSNGNYPFGSYYFRTHFNLPAPPTANGLITLSNYVDDGAVFYFNGAEAYRLRMQAAPAVIANSTLATGAPCSGDATCPDVFGVSGSVLTNLVAGDNVLAVQVHNYNAASPDITFGSALYYSIPFVVRPTLNVTNINGASTLTWTRGGVTLQQSDTPNGPWTNTPGPIYASPYTITNKVGSVFFRLIK